jgi:hypothetical protein
MLSSFSTGKNTTEWVSTKDPKAGAPWTVNADGSITVKPGAGDIQTARSFGDCQLHIEFRTPEVVKGEGQGRGNSGVFLQERYEGTGTRLLRKPYLFQRTNRLHLQTEHSPGERLSQTGCLAELRYPLYSTPIQQRRYSGGSRPRNCAAQRGLLFS